MDNPTPHSVKENNKTPFSVLFTLLAGLMFISLVLVTIMLSIASSSSAGKIVGYFLLAFSGLGIGYYIYHVRQKLNATERLGALIGIFSPTLSLIFIFTLLKAVQVLSKQLAIPSQGQNLGGYVTLFAPNINPLIAGILFYLSCNIFVIILIIKNKKYKDLLWYLIAVILFYVLWTITDLLISLITESKLMSISCQFL